MVRKNVIGLLFASAGALFAAGAMAQQQSSGVHAHAAPAAAAALNADRTIVIQPGTRYVNVTNGETVLFQVGGKSFVRKFYSMLSHGSFSLSEIAPADVDVHGIVVYCQPDLYERAG